MTGTPLQNNIGELWSLLNMLMPAVFAEKGQFNEWFDFSKYEDQNLKMQMVKKLHLILRPFMLRRTKNDLAKKLPDKIEINISVELSALQLDMYKEYLLEAGKSRADSFVSRFANANLGKWRNAIMQLRKICNHPYLFPGIEDDSADEYGEHVVEASGKLTFVDRLLKKILPKKE